MDGVLNIPMRSEFTLDIFISQKSHLGRQLLAVDAEYPSVQRNRRKKSHRRGAQGGF